METKINIAEILRDKPQGTKLYSSACGKCVLKEADDKSFKISFYSSRFGFMTGGEGTFGKNGNLYDDGECIIFPSKKMRDWSKFVWKKGDVLVGRNKVHIIFEKFEDDDYISFKGKHYLWKGCGEEDYSKEESKMATSLFEKANADVAQTYINIIEKRFGGKLIRETLEIEKTQPEFKDGDIVLVESHMLGISTSFMIAIFRKEKEIGKYKFSPALYESNEHDTYLKEDPIVLSPSDIKTFRPATDSEKQQLFDALAKEGKAWDAEKKQIADLKPKWTPKTFDRVITRDFDDGVWSANIFSHMNSQGEYVSIGCVEGYAYCLPYNEETAKLIGTTKDVED